MTVPAVKIERPPPYKVIEQTVLTCDKLEIWFCSDKLVLKRAVGYVIVVEREDRPACVIAVKLFVCWRSV